MTAVDLFTPGVTHPDPRDVRASDPDTSLQAAARQTPGKKLRDQERVLACHARHPEGLDDFLMAQMLGGQQTSLGKRRGELVAKGLIRKTDRRGLSPSGSPVIVWAVTAAGLEAAAALREQGAA